MYQYPYLSCFLNWKSFYLRYDDDERQCRLVGKQNMTG